MNPELLHPRHWPTWFGVGLLRAIGLLPFPLLWALGMALGRLLWVVGRRLSASRLEVARRNIAACLPHSPAQEREEILKRHLGFLGVAALSQGLAWGASRRRLARLVKFRDLSRFETSQAQGRNIILLVPHFVGLELGGSAFTGLVHPGLYMYQRIRNPVLDDRMRAGRMRFGALAVERNEPLRTTVRRIRTGIPFFYLPDQDAGRERGVFVPFCGVAAATAPMLGRFAAVCDAVVIPTYTRFLPRGRGLEVIFDPPLADFPSGDARADTATMNRTIEARLSSMPAQYFWVHKRFKTRPEGEPPFYPAKGR